jgi:hypothetical protein
MGLRTPLYLRLHGQSMNIGSLLNSIGPAVFPKRQGDSEWSRLSPIGEMLAEFGAVNCWLHRISGTYYCDSTQFFALTKSGWNDGLFFVLIPPANARFPSGKAP